MLATKISSGTNFSDTGSETFLLPIFSDTTKKWTIPGTGNSRYGYVTLWHITHMHTIYRTGGCCVLLAWLKSSFSLMCFWLPIGVPNAIYSTRNTGQQRLVLLYCWHAIYNTGGAISSLYFPQLWKSCRSDLFQKIVFISHVLNLLLPQRHL